MVRRVVAIVNPVSGRNDRWPAVRRVGEALKSLGGDLEVLVTQGPGHATSLTAAVSQRADAILVVGGDGTICEVVNGLVGSSAPLLVFGTGTENLLVRELRTPRQPEEIAHTLMFGCSFAVDVGVVNDRRFLSVVGVGFDAECVWRFARLRRGHVTHGTYFWPIWRTYWAHHFPRLTVETEDEVLFEGRGLVFVGGIGRYATGLRILHRARWDDGLLDVCVFPCSTKTKLIGHALRVLTRRHLHRGGTIYRQVCRVSIRSPETVPIEVDGEPGEPLPIECSILPRAVTFLC